MPEVVVHKECTPFLEEVGKAFDAIRAKAFELFDKRGGGPGTDVQDWLAAEQDLFLVPDAHVTETEHEYRVAVDVKGFEDADLHVTAEADHLVIAADMEKFTRNMSESKSMFRRIPVAGIVPGKVTADLNKTILTITAPKVTALAVRGPVSVDRPAARAVEPSGEKKNGETEAVRPAAA